MNFYYKNLFFSCGALLHCADRGIPGYVPSEKFKDLDDSQLKEIICQRCEYLKHFNVSLDVTVSAEDYPLIISKIREKNSLVIIMVSFPYFVILFFLLSILSFSD